MSIQHFGKGALRVAKNYTKGYSDVQSKVRDATSNDPWGPSGTQMNEIAQMTYNQNDFVEIMEMLDKRLNDKGKNWRHVFKSLTLLDYCLHAGSENVVIYFRDNIYVIKTLKEFQFVDEYGKDQGANVRQKAKDITNLLTDEARLREERRSRAHMRDRMTSRGDGGEPPDDLGIGGDENQARRQRNRGGDDDDLRRAIEESKRSAAEHNQLTAEERDLQEAMRLSREEEDKRNKALQDSTEQALFDDSQQLSANNGLQLVDTSAQNGFQGLQPQYTAIQPQFTAFNPYQQQAQQEAMQQQWAQQQSDWMRQQQEIQAQQQAQAQQEEWMRQQQLLQQQQQQQQQQQWFLQQQQQAQLQAQASPLQMQPTGFGSNNPFAPAQPTNPFPPPQSSPSPGAGGPGSSINFNLGGTFDNRPAPNTTSPSIPQQQKPGPSPGPGPAKGPNKMDQQHSHLANLIGNAEDGVDTFGNWGQLRYGGPQNTGTNPFQKPQQQQAQNPDQPFFSI